MNSTIARLVPALLALTPVAAQTRWVVDDDPGPGVDFSTVDVPVRADPTLRLIGEPRPGANVTIALDGEPGDRARLEVGDGPANIVSPGSPVPRLVTPGRIVPLGEIPNSATVQLSLRIPSSALPGDLYWLQAFAVDPTGAGRRTNSLTIVVRE